MKIFKLLTILLSVMICVACADENPIDLDMDQDMDQNMDPANDDVTKLNGGNQTLTGELSDGKILGSLDWAWQSSTACFVEPAAFRFQGNHLFYQFDLPTQSELTVNLIPENASSSMALYGYSKGAGNITLPEDLNSAVSCEADPSVGFGGSDTGSRSIELRATTNPYSVIIGVAGAENVTSGAFTLEILLEN